MLRTWKSFTDSSGNSELGCGAFFKGQWAQYRWPGSWLGSQILGNLSLLELIPIVLALFIWAPEFANQKVTFPKDFRADNQALVFIINKRTSKDKQIMKLIRHLVFLTMYNNIQFKALHILGCKNEIADALSRLQMVRFRTLAPASKANTSGLHGSHFNSIIKELLSNSMSVSTKLAYNRGLGAFQQFRDKFGLPHIWSVPIYDVMCFISYMFEQNLSYSTINCYISCINFFSKINFFEDCTNSFVVRKMLVGARRTAKRSKDTRLPITGDLLSKIILASLYFVIICMRQHCLVQCFQLVFSVFLGRVK